MPDMSTTGQHGHLFISHSPTVSTPWRNFLTPEFGTKFQMEISLLLEIPNFPKTQYSICRGKPTYHSVTVGFSSLFTVLVNNNLLPNWKFMICTQLVIAIQEFQNSKISGVLLFLKGLPLWPSGQSHQPRCTRARVRSPYRLRLECIPCGWSAYWLACML